MIKKTAYHILLSNKSDTLSKPVKSTMIWACPPPYQSGVGLSGTLSTPLSLHYVQTTPTIPHAKNEQTKDLSNHYKSPKANFLNWAILALCLLFTSNISAQSNLTQSPQLAQNKTEIKKKNTKAQQKRQQQARKNKAKKAATQQKAFDANSPIREEIQRYMGYELLPERYLSLPYDLTMNTNVNGGFVDIGYLLFMFIPVILLLGFVRKPLYGSIIMVVSLVILSISTTTSFGIKRGIKQPLNIDENVDIFIDAVPFWDLPVSVACAYVYRGLCYIYEPTHTFIRPYSGKSDAITYPLLTLLFVGFFFVLQKRLQHHDKHILALANFLYLFTFVWWILASGIVWYGYLILALGFAFMVSALSKYRGDTSRLKKITFGLFAFMAFSWVVMGYVYRISNHHFVTADSARLLFDIPSVKYQTGVFDEGDVINNLLPGVEKALDEINANPDALVYRIGTFIPYFIKENDRRVLQDNQLGFFHQLTQKFKDRTTLTEALKASGYRYILVDLNTSSIDKTPEKSLTAKYNSFLGYLFGNQDLELLATNRVITLTPPNSPNPIYTHGVFGNVHKSGTFAVYKIK